LFTEPEHGFCIPSTCISFLDLDKNVTYNRKNKAVEKESMEARNERWHVTNSL
jgi:hypothetical protein